MSVPSLPAAKESDGIFRSQTIKRPLTTMWTMTTTAAASGSTTTARRSSINKRASVRPRLEAQLHTFVRFLPHNSKHKRRPLRPLSCQIEAFLSTFLILSSDVESFPQTDVVLTKRANDAIQRSPSQLGFSLRGQKCQTGYGMEACLD